MTNDIYSTINKLKTEQKIHVEGYRGFWSVIDTHLNYLLLEHNTYGDETCYLVVDARKTEMKRFHKKDGTLTPPIPNFPHAFETYDDITTCLEDEGII